MNRHRSPPRRRSLSVLPTFALYGEVGLPGLALLHVESIASRSRQYNWEIDAHVHKGLHQVLWLRTGNVDSMLDESRSTCDGPAVLVIPPGVAHAFKFSPKSEGFVLTVNATMLAEGSTTDIGEALQALFASSRTLALDPASPDVNRLQALFDILHTEHEAGDSAESPVPLWLARSIIWRLAQLGKREESRAGRRGTASHQSLYTRWVVLMESHYLEHWPVTRYAERLGLSTERLNRMVRSETGFGAQALLLDRLAREASRRLVHVAAPVSRLAFELGFEDPAYFCRFFKRHTGMSPRDYRAKALRVDERGELTRLIEKR